ncbi:methyltransferase family protein [Nocardiopsis sp. Huas11]|uniref:class I SAM-dependent methyltransferase n=1 Tax=Nocardiopsis sp. Huas11 TaxID=2183912 RepID=UPI000F1EFDF0|nr:class I SAM-dependent methyltransferase [Nocardiopsis sp. Huas11]RKS09311.1 methyltransferase family protein [Nocardiopsis sp. Huas11]
MPHTTPEADGPGPAVANTEQARMWNGDDGRRWAAQYLRYDEMLAAYTPPLLDAAGITAEQRVLDVGCGAGVTTCAAARAARGGEAVGVDLSRPLLEHARRRAGGQGLDHVRFEEADAQVHPFPEAAFDTAISRFGTMFFADPVAAFGNIARAMAPRGRLAFLCWQRPQDIDWTRTLRAALAPFVELPTPDTDGPGPYSLAEPRRTRELLAAGGFDEIAIESVREPVSLGGDMAEAMAFVSEMGPVRGPLSEVDPATRTRALDSLRNALAAHRADDGVRVGSAAWLVTARRG